MNEQNRTIGDEADEDIEKIKDEFKSEPQTVRLKINRVPEYVSNDLKDLANEKFAGDYGMALTFWHQRQERMDDVISVVHDLVARVARLERALDQKNKEEEEENDTEGLETLN